MGAKNYHLRYKARARLAAAVLYSKVTPPMRCEQCQQEGKIHGHHTDYALPLDVMWLCPTCHKHEHRVLDKGKQVRTIADRAMLAAHRQRDRATANVDRWRGLAAVVPDPWTSDRLANASADLADAERTVAELERGAGVPIIMDEERGEA